MTASAVTSPSAATSPLPLPPPQSVAGRGGERDSLSPLIRSYLQDTERQARPRPTLNAQGQLIGQIIDVSA